MNICPVVSPTEKNGEWILKEELTWADYTVPKGFITDGASIPWIAQLLIKKGGPLFGPAVIHDYIYRNGLGTKKEGDLIFRSAMKSNGVNSRKRGIIYNAVRYLGRWSWKGD